ncbi:MAG: hypothetical protein HOQ02_02935 [Lysobacter sp.]|nr:hypothetical protein [Lysobacter sp.]
MNKLSRSMLLAVFLLAGCASTSKVMLGHARAPIAPEQVRVYNQPPPRYHEIALLETQSGSFTYGEQNKMNAVLDHLRKAAAELGANGVLLQEQGNDYRGGGVGVGVGGGRFGGHTSVGGGVGIDISPTQKHARAIAIYVEPGEAPPTP